MDDQGKRLYLRKGNSDISGKAGEAGRCHGRLQLRKGSGDLQGNCGESG